jgi:oligoendopeptidase F
MSMKRKREGDDATLPRWDLSSKFGWSDAYDRQIDDLLDRKESECVAFKAAHESKLASTLSEAVAAYEKICVDIAKIDSFLSLSYDTALEDDALKKRKGAISQRCAALSGDHLTFFELELADLGNASLEAQIAASPALAKFKPYIEEVRRSRPFNLSQPVERALTVRAPYVGTNPVVEFYDKELSLLRFDDPAGGEKPINMELLLSKLSSSTDAQLRARAMHSLNEGLKGFERIAALSLNCVAGSWLLENKERGYATVRSRRNVSNNVPDEVVASLLEGVRTAGVALSKRYYTLKKGVLKATQGLTALTWSDRNAPIEIGGGEEKGVTWDEAVRIVKEGYHGFSPTMAALFQKMIDEKRIDVPPTDGKKAGAYCSGATPLTGPFQLLNFAGTKNDVATLAHESGHGCHDILAYGQGYLQYHPPLTLAETASIFGEMIVFRQMLRDCPSTAERLSMLMSKIDDVINSVVRQCSFDRFEEKLHAARADGDLAPEDLTKMWVDVIDEYYGEAGVGPFDKYDDVSNLWSYVPHFHPVPFYVYSYAFADLVVGSLYGSFLKKPEGFEGRLLDLLRAGGTKGFVEALEPFGLRPNDPAFWGEALTAHLGGLMDEAEAIAKDLGYAA